MLLRFRTALRDLQRMHSSVLTPTAQMHTAARAANDRRYRENSVPSYLSARRLGRRQILAQASQGNVALACSVVWRLVTYPPEINVADQTRCPVTAHEARSYDVTCEVEG